MPPQSAEKVTAKAAAWLTPARNKGLPEPRVASGSTRLGRRGSVSIKRHVQTPPRRRPLDTPNHLLVSGWRQQEPASELQNQENFSYVPYVYVLRQHVSGVTFANGTCMEGNTGVFLSRMSFGFFFLPVSVPLQLSLLLSLDAASPFPSSFCHSTHWLLFPTRLLQASLPKHCGGHIPLLGRLVGSSPSSSSHPVWLRLCNHAISSFLKQFLCWGPIQQFSGLESCLISFQNKFFWPPTDMEKVTTEAFHSLCSFGLFPSGVTILILWGLNDFWARGIGQIV